MHCDSPTCAEVCPADAIKRTEDGVVQTRPQAALHRLRQLRAGLPVRRAEDEHRIELMMKCDMCYDRTSVGKKPMCATVCPSQALFFGTREEIEQLRPRVPADQPLPVRRPDDHDQGQHDGPAEQPRSRVRRRHRRHARDDEPRSVPLNLLDDALYEAEEAP